MVDLYKKPKNMFVGMYYSKDHMGRRRNNNYYGYSNKYRGYNYYNKLHNYRKGNHYEAQQGVVAEQQREQQGEQQREQRGVVAEQQREKQKEEVPASDPAKEANGSGKTEGKKRKAEKETEKDEVGSRDKKKETSRKKCIIKILKRPTEAVNNEEGKDKNPVGGEKRAMEETEQKEPQKEQQKKKKKEKAKENEREGAKDCVEQKSKKKKEGEGITSKAKKVKDGFKFTSTQELFNLLLKDVKNNSLDEEDDEEEMAKQAKKKKGATKSGDPAKGLSEGTKMESENENAKKSTKRSIPDLAKKGATSAMGVKDTQPGRNDDVAQQHNQEVEKIAKESEQGKSIKGKEGNNSSDVPKSDKIIEAEEKCSNSASKNSAAQTTKTAGANAHVKESAIALKGKKGTASGSNKYNNHMSIGSNISRGRKIIKIIKNVENGRYYYTGSRKNLAAVVDGFGGGGAAGHYVKYATSKYPNFTTSCSLLSQASNMELYKHNSLNSRLINSLRGGMGAGQRNDDCRRAGKKEEEEGFFAVPIYMRSPKPEQIPIPVYLSEVADQMGAQEGAQEGTQERLREVREVPGVQTDVKAAIEAPPEAANVQGRKSKSKGQAQNAKGAPNGNAHNKDSQNAQNFTKKNEQNNHANKHSYDFMNTGNVKSNKMYNMYWMHSSYVKGANYNGSNLHGSGKNLKMEKYFHNKRYKVKAYLSDNNQKSKNLNPLKEVKIAVY
ncbi:hypothetical protein PCYB_053260 [Plasmodium cynomolgi strain B]|uniref:Uncharacterized protein n=1 Tax=Plasmodium cynomolgi (strain B) TaxID=1120755 RepID=K6UIT6_PLACD|nr:hypothetical protein PCYB_053260 [Plasmodium cynomolgi strain B]GAB65308.1 hypothetical protein PCYB_053260 [Plasmodium cynomolgi strain B]